jgi:hypothetical protein
VIACGVLATAGWLVVGLGGQDPEGRLVRDVDGAPGSALVVFDDWAPFTRAADEPTGLPASGSAQFSGMATGVRPVTRAQASSNAAAQASRSTAPGKGPSPSQRPAKASGGSSGSGNGNDNSGSKSPAKRG